MDTTPRYRLGLVLSGGGARGFAHIGVVQAMYEAGLRPDIISGTSAGSIVGAMIAAGHTPEECLNFFLGKKILHFARPTMSKKGIMIMNGMEERLAEFLHIKTFEELIINLDITASDIIGTVRYHYEIYLEVLEKYLEKLPHEIYQAVCENLLILESRIDDLINHHDDVTDYVNRLKKERDQLERRKYTQSKRLKDAHKEMELIRGSLSYRLGNALITPIKTAGVIAKNTKAI